MIQLTRLNHTPLVLNSDLIEHIEMTPDTVIALTTGQKFMVRESPDEIVAKIVTFRRTLLKDVPLSQSPEEISKVLVASPTRNA